MIVMTKYHKNSGEGSFMDNIFAVICEYNPFHNGHKYLVDTHRQELDSRGVICIMSGSFTQRGAPAVLDKWSRAEMAIKSGCDLVLELPVCFSSQSAERFAKGGVSLADSLGVVDYLSFGSECGDIDKLKRAAQFLDENDEIMKHYEEGISYPKARQKMVDELADSEMSEIIKSPNNILGIEYIKALKKLRSNIAPVTLKRKGSEHDAKYIEGNFASASKIREMLKNGENISDLVPDVVFSIIEREKNNLVFDSNRLSGVLCYILRTQPPEVLKDIMDMAEGLENRFIEAARTLSDICSISEFVKTKRYTKSRIDRIITNIILGITKDMKFDRCEYARVLALNNRGAEILKKINEKSKIPVITKTADNNLSGKAKEMFDLDVLSTDIYQMLTNDKRSGRDFIKSPVFVK